MSEGGRQLLPDPCTGRDIAARLCVSVDYWQHEWKNFVERYGFPAPLPGFRRPLKWDPVQVENWIRAKRSIESLAPPAIELAGDKPRLSLVR